MPITNDPIPFPTLPSQEQIREQIKAAARDQSYIGQLDYPTFSSQMRNPFCGDEIETSLALDDCGLIRDLKAQIRGCLVARAAWALLAPKLIGLSRGEAIGLIHQVKSELGDEHKKLSFTALPAPLTTLLAYRLPSPRHSCATLGSDAVLKALQPEHRN